MLGAMTARARHCMACGARLGSARVEGRARRRCPRCGWIFYDNPVPAAVAIVRGPRGILLARRARPPHQDTWDLPGGFLEAGEDPEQGLRRELREELGAVATAVRFHCFALDRYGPGGIHILAIVYVARLRGTPTARSDVAEVRWFALDAIPWREIAFPSIIETLRRFPGVRGPGRARGGRPGRRGGRARPRARGRGSSPW